MEVDNYSMDQPQQPLPPRSDDIYATQMQEDRVANLIAQISPDNQLMELQWRIKGYIKNPRTMRWKKTNEAAPEPSALLVSNYISFLSSILNQNTTLSNYSTHEINALMKIIIRWVTDDLRTNAVAYNIGSNYTERSRIGHILLIFTYSAFKRALNGQESRRIFRALSVAENISPQSQPRGFLDALQFWKK